MGIVSSVKSGISNVVAKVTGKTTTKTGDSSSIYKGSSPAPQSTRATPTPSASMPSSSGAPSGGGGGGGMSTRLTPTPSATTGQFIDAKTGLAYSGTQKSPFDLPVAGTRVTTTTAMGTTTTTATTQRTLSGGGGGGSRVQIGTTPTGQQAVTTTPSTTARTLSPIQSYSPEPPTGNVMTAYGGLSTMAGTSKIGYGEATVQTIKDIGTNIKYAFTGTGKYFNPFQSFERTGREKSEMTAYYQTNYGTMQTTGFDTKTGQPITKSYLQPVTFLDVQKQTELTRGIQISSAESELTKLGQSRIASGEDYNKVVEDINKQYAERQSQIYSKLPDVQGFTTRSGKAITVLAPAVAETAGLIGLSVVSPTTGLAVASAYSFGRGFQQTVEAPTFGGKTLGFATMALAGVGARASLLNIEKQIVAGQIEYGLERLGKSRLKFSQVEFQADRTGLVVFKGTQKVAGFERTISGQGMFVVGKSGRTTFMPVGQYTSSTRGEVWNIYSRAGASKTVYTSGDYGRFTAIGKSYSQIPLRGQGFVGVKELPEGIKSFASKYGAVRVSSAEALAGISTPTKSIVGFTTKVTLFKTPTMVGRSFGLIKETGKTQLGTVYSSGALSQSGNIKGSLKGNILVVGKQSQQTTDIVGTRFFGGGVGKTPFFSPQEVATQIQTPKTTGLSDMTKQISQGLSKTQIEFKTSGFSTTLLGGVYTRQETSPQTNIKVLQLQQMVTPTIEQTTPRVIGGQVPQIKPISRVTQRVIQIQPIPPIERQLPTPTFTTPTIPRPTQPNIPFRESLPIPPFAFPSISSGKLRYGSGEIKATRTYKYTPSFKAVVFGLKGGKTPSTKQFTGLETRRITKGFKWSNVIKL